MSACIGMLGRICAIELEESDFMLACFDVEKEKVFLEWTNDEYKIR